MKMEKMISEMSMIIDLLEEINGMKKKTDGFKELEEESKKRKITVTVHDIMTALSAELAEYFAAIDDEMDVALKIYMLDTVSTIVANMTHRLEDISRERSKND